MKNKHKLSTFDIVVTIIMAIVLFICIYPFIYELAISLSDGKAVAAGRITFYSIGTNLQSYFYILTAERLGIVKGFVNSVVYTGLGTVAAVFVTFMTAYVLTRRKFRPRRLIMFLFMMCYVFEAGIVPTYIIQSKLGLVNNILVMILPMAINTYLLIICRTFLNQIPVSLEEAAVVDGANDWTAMWKIFFPVSKPTIATITLFYLVQKWNDYLTPLIYLQKKELQPLQLILYNFTAAANSTGSPLENINVNGHMLSYQTLTAAIVIITIVPILLVYPFAQRYFTTGLMVGSVKE